MSFSRGPRVVVPLVWLAACGGGDDSGVINTTERTLDNCDTTLDTQASGPYALMRCVTQSVSGGVVTIETANLPPHLSYYYGEGDANYTEFDFSRGDAYQPNPNNLLEQDVAIAIPLDPTPRGVTITDALVDGVVDTDDGEYPMGAAGVSLDSTVLFNPLAAPGDDIEDEQYTFDSYNAHPENQGTYHYHTTTPGPLEVLAWHGYTDSTTPGAATVEIYGVMCDGTVVLGCTEADGSAPADDTDAQGGHVGDIVGPDGATWFTNRYHTHVCETGRRFTPEIQYYDTCDVGGAADHAHE